MIGELISTIGLGAGTVFIAVKLREERKRLEELNRVLNKIDGIHMSYAKLINKDMLSGTNVNEANVEKAQKLVKELEKAWSEAAEIAKR